MNPSINVHLETLNRICFYSKILPFPFNISEGILSSRLPHLLEIFDKVFAYQCQTTQIPHE